jgi:hypothetical protein
MVQNSSQNRRRTTRSSSITDPKEVLADVSDADAKNSAPPSPSKGRRLSIAEAAETSANDRKASVSSSKSYKSETNSDQVITAFTSPEPKSLDSDSGTVSSTSTSSNDSLLEKSKEQLVRAAQELEAQFEDLIKMYRAAASPRADSFFTCRYQQEKRIFLEKSIKLLEKGMPVSQPSIPMNTEP